MRKLVYILAFVLMLAGLKSTAQQEVYKVSKQMNRNFTKEVKMVEISGEKATIEIEGWNKDFIEVHIRLISRNPHKKRAESDLQNIKTDLIQTGSTLRIMNLFEGKSELITSNLSVEYQMTVPEKVSINVRNLYGKVVAKNITDPLCVNVSFGSLQLDSVWGNSTIISNYCSIRGNNIGGSFSCTAEKTDINLTNVNALVKIESKYGEIALVVNSNQYPVTINSHRTKLSLTIPEKPFNYKLKTLYSEISVPGMNAIKDDFYEKKTSDQIPMLELNTSYCPIIILTEKNQKEQ